MKIVCKINSFVRKPRTAKMLLCILHFMIEVYFILVSHVFHCSCIIWNAFFNNFPLPEFFKGGALIWWLLDLECLVPVRVSRSITHTHTHCTCSPEVWKFLALNSTGNKPMEKVKVLIYSFRLNFIKVSHQWWYNRYFLKLLYFLRLDSISKSSLTFFFRIQINDLKYE